MEKFTEVQQIFAENSVSAQYCNYPDINFQDYAQMNYGKNYPKLQQIKNLYDPDNLIRHEQSIKNA
jgi:FAD/FMN-containing dehydrogenase